MLINSHLLLHSFFHRIFLISTQPSVVKGPNSICFVIVWVNGLIVVTFFVSRVRSTVIHFYYLLTCWLWLPVLKVSVLSYSRFELVLLGVAGLIVPPTGERRVMRHVKT